MEINSLINSTPVVVFLLFLIQFYRLMKIKYNERGLSPRPLFFFFGGVFLFLISTLLMVLFPSLFNESMLGVVAAIVIFIISPILSLVGWLSHMRNVR